MTVYVMKDMGTVMIFLAVVQSHPYLFLRIFAVCIFLGLKDLMFIQIERILMIFINREFYFELGDLLPMFAWQSN